VHIFLVDDHSLFRGGLESLLEKRDDLEVVGTASSGAEALERIPAIAPDVVLLDLKMPGMDGLTTLKELVGAGIEASVVMLTVSDDEALRAVALAAIRLKLVAEPGGAVALAAALFRADRIEGGAVIAVITGGNADSGLLARALSDFAPD